MLQASCPTSVPAHRHPAVRHVAPRCGVRAESLAVSRLRVQLPLVRRARSQSPPPRPYFSTAILGVFHAERVQIPPPRCVFLRKAAAVSQSLHSHPHRRATPGRPGTSLGRWASRGGRWISPIGRRIPSHGRRISTRRCRRPSQGCRHPSLLLERPFGGRRRTGVRYGRMNEKTARTSEEIE
jgi:hypothetical protein